MIRGMTFAANYNRARFLEDMARAAEMLANKLESGHADAVTDVVSACVSDGVNRFTVIVHVTDAK